MAEENKKNTYKQNQTVKPKRQTTVQYNIHMNIELQEPHYKTGNDLKSSGKICSFCNYVLQIRSKGNVKTLIVLSSLYILCNKYCILLNT